MGLIHSLSSKMLVEGHKYSKDFGDDKMVKLGLRGLGLGQGLDNNFQYKN